MKAAASSSPPPPPCDPYSAVAYSFALPHEIAEFEEEYGRFQSDAAKRSVRRSGKSAVEFDAKWSAARPEPCASPMAMYMYP